MTNELIPFRFKTHDVRTVIIDGEPWFVAKDVCDVLRIANSRDAMSRIPDKDKGVGQTDTLGGVQKTTVVSEAGLYRLVLRSDKPEAEPFIDWVTSEVLPALRKTGKYEMQKVSSTPVQPPLPGEIVSREFEALHRMAKLFGYEGNQAILCADKAVKKLHNLSPVALLGVELKSPDNEALLIATEIGKRLNPPVSAKQVNLLLANMKLQEKAEYRAGKFEWRLTDRGKAYGSYLDTGKVHSNGTPIQQIKWKESILPLVQKHSDSL